MTNRSSLGVVEFGRCLLETGDLDPLYIALHRANLARPLLCRWLLAYFCFYSAGLSCWIVDRKDYWGTMRMVPKKGTMFPRGAERRHFRGEFAERAVYKLSQDWPNPEDLINWLGNGGPSAAGVMKRVKSLYGFGEWISWKVPDICERLGLIRVDFVDRDVDLMFSSSLEGARETAKRHAPSNDPLMSAHQYLLRSLRGLKAPPLYDRPINVQETETIFCKWKSHLGGHYPLGKDSHEIRLGLLRYAGCKTAQRLLKSLPRVAEGL